MGNGRAYAEKANESASTNPRWAPAQSARGHARTPVLEGPHFNFASIPLYPQAKLEVGAASDPLEKEADQTADRVMRMPDRASTAGVDALPVTGNALQRKCDGCEEEEKMRRKTTESSAPGGMLAPPVVHEALGSQGRPLDAETRSFMEPRFGRDFGDVRVHTGPTADESARATGATAYTVGSHLVFRDGAFAPSTDGGRRLLAHELTHVVQQGEAGRAGPRVMRYRNGGANFGALDKPGLVETKFTRKIRKEGPWIEKILIKFTSSKVDSDGDVVPTGTLTATYFANRGALPPLTANVIGGKASAGLNDHVHDKAVTRVEGAGYNDQPVDKADAAPDDDRLKHFKMSKVGDATMSFAVFIVEGRSTGHQALHVGSLTEGSLACTHVPEATMQRINYHSVAGHTLVTVTYDEASRVPVCCARFNATGRKRMVSNPCHGVDPKKCSP
jgi:hypothetical protein